MIDIAMAAGVMVVQVTDSDFRVLDKLNLDIGEMPRHPTWIDREYNAHGIDGGKRQAEKLRNPGRRDIRGWEHGSHKAKRHDPLTQNAIDDQDYNYYLDEGDDPPEFGCCENCGEQLSAADFAADLSTCQLCWHEDESGQHPSVHRGARVDYS